MAEMNAAVVESHINSRHNISHMQGLSIGDKIRAEARKSSNGYVAVIQDSELLIRNDNSVTAGDSVTARIVGPNSVIISNSYDYCKEGLPGELFAIVDSCPDHHPSKVRCVEPPFVGEQFWIEELESESNDIIPILPLDAKAELRAAICTKPSFWPGERVGERSEYSYSDELVECFNNSEAVSPDRVEKLKGLIAKTRTVKQAELQLTETDFIAPEALEHISDNTDFATNDKTGDKNRSSVERQLLGRPDVDNLDERICELYEDLRSDNQGIVENAAVELAKLAQEEPKRIQPTIERLQEVVRDGSNYAPGKALSALARYGSKVDRSAVDVVKNEISDLLVDNWFNQQNALIAATVLDNSQFSDQAKKLTHVDNTSTAAAATLTYVRVTDSDLDWLPVRQKHTRQLISGGTDILQKKNPEYLLYLMDARCGESGQSVSARDKLLSWEEKSSDFASTVSQFINEYPDKAVSSLHISILSHVAESHPQTVIRTLEKPFEKVQDANGSKLHQYLWTMANIAEGVPDTISEEVIRIARRVVVDGDEKPAVQAIRLLGAVEDTKSRRLIENRMERGNKKVRSAALDVLESFHRDSEKSNTVAESDSIYKHNDTDQNELVNTLGQPIDAPLEERGDLTELRKRAEDAARKNPVREQVTSISSQYYRSNRIKEYAKARANGICECCGEPAPFNDENGEPYLEVHHVDELGEGGSDHPDRVAAVCPTCHRHIHYGSGGGELNSVLQEKLESGLSDIGRSL